MSAGLLLLLLALAAAHTLTAIATSPTWADVRRWTT